MRTIVLRTAAGLIALLGIPALAWQMIQAWPLGQIELAFLGLQAVVLGVFGLFAVGKAYQPVRGEVRERG